MNAILLACTIAGSVFSIGGLGEDLSVFRTPFVPNDNIARIGFTLNPEYAVLNESSDLRGVFWTNPFQLSFSVPVSHGLRVMVGNLERYNQCFDVYLEDSVLQVHAIGEGGVEELFAGISKNLGPFDLALTGSYLFGSAWEIWTYRISAYSLVDTFFYDHRGQIFAIGLNHSLFSLLYEGFGSVRMIRVDQDTTTVDLPQRMSVGVHPRVGDWSLGVVYERSWWKDGQYATSNRFKVQAGRDLLGFAYYYNPWYLDGVSEHGLECRYSLPLRNAGVLHVKMGLAMRSRDDLREFRVAPQLSLVLNEIFARRRK